MPTTDRLAEIKAAVGGAHPDYVYISMLTQEQVNWLIAEVERQRAQLAQLADRRDPTWLDVLAIHS
jgi:hypothetical protein